MLVLSLRILIIAISAAVLIGGDAAAQSARREDPTVAKETDFGKTAIFDTVPRGSSAKDWNIVNFGLFCGTKVILPGRVVGYVYGIGEERLGSGKPLAASIDIDGKTTELSLKPFEDIAFAPLDYDFVRSFLQARSVSIQIKDYVSPQPDRLKLEHLETRLKSALKKCHKF